MTAPQGRGIDTLVGLALAAVLVLSGLFGLFLLWVFRHGAVANERTVPVLAGAAAFIGVGVLAGIEGLLRRRSETGMVVRFVVLGVAALALLAFLVFAAVKLLTPGH